MARSEPRYCPSAVALLVPSWSTDVSFGSVSGAQASHAASAAPADGNEALKWAASPTRCTRVSKRVTIPKLPPPAPRSAQNRSGSWRASTRRSRPSGVTTTSPVTLSAVSPKAREASP